MAAPSRRPVPSNRCARRSPDEDHPRPSGLIVNDADLPALCRDGEAAAAGSEFFEGFFDLCLLLFQMADLILDLVQ